MFFVFPNGFANKNVVVPNSSLVNRPNLDKILKAEVFVHSNDQLRVAHLILGYTPDSKSFQVLKCVIKAKDPHLHWINVAILGFLIIDPRSQGVLKVEPLPPYKAEHVATPSRPVIQKAEEEKEEGEKEQVFKTLGS